MRTTLFIAASLFSVQSFAESLPADAPTIAQAGKGGKAPAPAPAPAAKPAAKPAPSKDDEDEDEPPKQQAPAAAAPAPAAGAVVAPAAQGVDAQKLVSGAPLYNPNVAVHIVEQKEFSDRGRFEIVLQPSVQVNGKFTQHYGLGGSIIWHLQENFGLMAMGLWNYLSMESGFNGELIDKVRAEAQAATSLLLMGGALGGVEAMPFYGKFAVYDSYLVHFSVVLNGGAGAGATRHQLKPVNDAGPATFGETGWRFLAEIGGGFRVKLGRWVAIRLELRDVLYTARVDSVNGCGREDLKAMDEKLRGGRPVTEAVVLPACNVGAFNGVDDQGDDDPGNDRKRSDDVPLAFALVKTPSSDVLNNLGLYLGVSVNF